MAKLVTRIMTPRADASGDFLPGAGQASADVSVSANFARAVLKAAPVTGEHVLVYVTSPAPAVAKLLSWCCPFVAYGFGREGQNGNVLTKPAMDQFLKDLISAKAVIANAGFFLMRRFTWENRTRDSHRTSV